jgi:hypothetical protein
MVIIIVVSVIVWISIPPMLSRAMAQRGYDATSYLVIGALFAPVVIALAVMEVLLARGGPPLRRPLARRFPDSTEALVPATAWTRSARPA